MAYLKQPITLKEIQSNLNFFSRYPDFLLYTGKEVFRLRDKVEAYLTQPYPSREEKQKAHGNLIWLLKNYYSTPFQQEAITFLNRNVSHLDLTDKDKLNYLNYILTMKNYTRFSPQFFSLLSHYSPGSEASAEQGNRAFHRMKILLAKNYKKDDNYQEAAVRFYPFLCVYAKNCPRVTNQLIDDYTQLLFKMSAKFPWKRVSLMPLKDLLDVMTEQSMRRMRMESLFGDEFEPKPSLKPQMHKTAVQRVLTNYISYGTEALKKKRFDHVLHISMTSMLGHIVENYDYNDSDIRALRKVLGRKNSLEYTQKRFYDMGLEIQHRFNKSRPAPRKKLPKSVLQRTIMDAYLDH